MAHPRINSARVDAFLEFDGDWSIDFVRRLTPEVLDRAGWDDELRSDPLLQPQRLSSEQREHQQHVLASLAANRGFGGLARIPQPPQPPQPLQDDTAAAAAVQPQPRPKLRASMRMGTGRTRTRIRWASDDEDAVGSADAALGPNAATDADADATSGAAKQSASAGRKRTRPLSDVPPTESETSRSTTSSSSSAATNDSSDSEDELPVYVYGDYVPAESRAEAAADTVEAPPPIRIPWERIPGCESADSAASSSSSSSTANPYLLLSAADVRRVRSGTGVFEEVEAAQWQLSLLAGNTREALCQQLATAGAAYVRCSHVESHQCWHTLHRVSGNIYVINLFAPSKSAAAGGQQETTVTPTEPLRWLAYYYCAG